MVRNAEEAARKGNMSKVRSILTGTGISISETTLEEICEKHPAALLLVLPSNNSDPQVIEEEVKALAKTKLRIGLCKLAERTLPNGAADQLGWQAREHLAPLLANVEAGQLMDHQILLPLSSRYVSLLYAHISSGDLFIAMSKFPKEGSRLLVIGNCLSCLVHSALSSRLWTFPMSGLRVQRQTQHNSLTGPHKVLRSFTMHCCLHWAAKLLLVLRMRIWSKMVLQQSVFLGSMP